MSELLTEVQESEKETKMQRILSNAAVFVFSVGVMLVVYLSMYSWYGNRQKELIEEDGAILTQTVNKINYNKNQNKTEADNQKLDEINKKNIEKLEKLAGANSSAYSGLANVYLASVALMEGNPSKAIYYYKRVSNDTNYSEILREYMKLVSINATLQFNKEVYDTPAKEITEYFTIDKDSSKEKYFSNAMAITGIALEDETRNFTNSAIYLASLKDYQSDNENVNFITDMLSKYMEQVNNEQK
jgi:hypothetical protein